MVASMGLLAHAPALVGNAVAQKRAEPVPKEAAAPRKEGGGPRFLSRKQQRSVKLFFLRASRPLLRGSGPSQARTPQPSSTSLTEAEAEELVALQLANGSDPLPLHAKQELLKKSGSTEGSRSIVDFSRLVELAQGVSFPFPQEWPVLGWHREDTAGPAEIDVAEEEERDEERVAAPGNILEADRESLEKTFNNPRCMWPRNAPPPEPLAASPSVSYPRCRWPRALRTQAAALEATPLAEPSLEEDLQRALADSKSQAVAEPASEVLPAARCAWPKAGLASQAPEKCLAGSGSTAISAVAEALSSPSIQASFQKAGPRCAWPRAGGRVGVPSTAAPFVPAGLGGASLTPAGPAGPRCAWPRGAVHSAVVAEAEQAEEEREEEGQVIMGGARCPWPRAGVSVKSS